MRKLRQRSLKVQKNNSFTFNKAKAIEELSELTTELAQTLTKGERDRQKIIDEIGDAQRMIWWLTKKYGKKEVKKRILTKIEKIERKYANSR